MYLVSIQSPSGNQEFICSDVNLALNQFNSLDGQKVLIIKQMDYVGEIRQD